MMCLLERGCWCSRLSGVQLANCRVFGRRSLLTYPSAFLANRNSISARSSGRKLPTGRACLTSSTSSTFPVFFEADQGADFLIRSLVARWRHIWASSLGLCTMRLAVCTYQLCQRHDALLELRYSSASDTNDARPYMCRSPGSRRVSCCTRHCDHLMPSREFESPTRHISCSRSLDGH
jgi:hypothetical protein